MTMLAKTLMEHPCLECLRKRICSMSSRELNAAIDESLAIMEMGVLKGKALENLKKGTSLLAQILLRRQGK